MWLNQSGFSWNNHLQNNFATYNCNNRSIAMCFALHSMSHSQYVKYYQRYTRKRRPFIHRKDKKYTKNDFLIQSITIRIRISLHVTSCIAILGTRHITIQPFRKSSLVIRNTCVCSTIENTK